MANLSTLGSPGIEVREIDNSLRPDVDPSTVYFVPGFASQGPVEEVHSIGSMTDFENIYGVPTNDAERYFYHTVKSLIDNSGESTTVYVSRLPYGLDSGDTVSSAYTLLSYPAVPVIKKSKDGHNFDYFKVTEDTKDAFKSVFSLDYNDSTIPVDDVQYSIIVDEDYLMGDIKVTKLELGSIKIGKTVDGTFEPGNLPDPTNLAAFNNDVKINYVLTTSSKGEETSHSLSGMGNIALEYDSTKKSFVIHLAFNLSNNDNKKIGVMTFTVTYNAFSNINKVNEMTFGDGGAATLVLNEIFEVAASYDGQTVEQYNKGDYDSEKFSNDITYVVGAPTSFQISLDQYYRIITGDSFKWSRRPYSMRKNGGFAHDVIDEDGNVTGTEYVPRKETATTDGSVDTFGLYDAISHSAFIVINTSRSIINEAFEGFYFGMCDNMFVTPSNSYKYNAIRNVKVSTKNVDIEKGDSGLKDSHSSTSDYDVIGESRLGFYLTDNHSGSISRIMERSVTPMDISSSEYDDTLNIGLFKLSKSVTANATLKLNYSIREKYNASIGRSRVKSEANATRPVSYFIENVAENSSNLLFMVNPYISEKSFVDLDGVLHSKVRVFGKKLVDNLNHFEKSYLIDNFSLGSNSGANGLMAPIKLAKSSVKSYESLVAQAGVSPYFLKKTLNVGEAIKNEDYEYFVMADSLYQFGVFSNSKNTSKIIGNLPTKLERALELVKNDEEYTKIDIIPEAGLGTIYAYSNGSALAGETTDYNSIVEETGDGEIGDDDSVISKLLFDSTAVLQGVEDLRTGRSSLSSEATKFVEDYLSVQNKFYAFCNAQANGGRGDSFFISDIPRGILIKGKDTKISSLFGTRLENSAYESSDETNHSFSTSILYPIKHLFENIVSSYGSTYAQWLKIHDDTNGEKMWVPASGYVAAAMGRSDFQSGPWLAAAGINRGVISNVLDCAYSPNQDQRTDLYKLCINSIPKLPNRGITIWGIRTMSKKASAFDQNTCRRTFLYMENTIKRYMRNYIFEPNTAYTRLQIVNDVEPFLENVAISGGIYSWSCVCDTSNNTPDIINNGDMAVDIAAAPTRTAENIILNFTANKYTSDISNAER